MKFALSGLVILSALFAAQTAKCAPTDAPAAQLAANAASPGAPGLKAVVADKVMETKSFFGVLRNDPVWRSYKAHFITPQGRVVDTGNANISHSEGQGYGMLLALAADDHDAFQRLWDWTRANLMVRDDSLLAWRWEPGKRPAVADMNDATDGDILVAWALAEAAKAWPNEEYKVAARRIAVDVGRRAIIQKANGDALLLPAMNGFSAEERSDGPVINLSYYIFPAFPSLAEVASEIDWNRVTQTGLSLIARSQFGRDKVPTDWISLKGGTVKPAAGFPPLFSYNAIRIPLYLLWAGVTDPKYIEPFEKLWTSRQRNGLPVVDPNTDQIVRWLQEPGYAAIADLVACETLRQAVPAAFLSPAANENYYPATLHLLAITVAKMRFKECIIH